MTYTSLESIFWFQAKHTSCFEQFFCSLTMNESDQVHMRAIGRRNWYCLYHRWLLAVDGFVLVALAVWSRTEDYSRNNDDVNITMEPSHKMS